MLWLSLIFNAKLSRWDEKTGEVWLAKKLDKPQSSVFLLNAVAKDNGLNQQKSTIPVTVEVKESSNKPPIFRQVR